MDRGHHFLIRVGANVRLLTKLGYFTRERDGIVYVWPDSAARKQQPPLVLRMIQLFAVKEQVNLGEPPRHTSAAMAIQAVRSILLLWNEAPRKGTDLQTRLQNAVLDPYPRHGSKRARYQPNKKDTPSAGKPKIAAANQKKKRQLERYRQHLANAV